MIPFDLASIFAAFALSISLLTLWFTHLKGPDIEFSPIKDTQLREWSSETFENWLSNNYVPRFLDIEAVDLIFFNSGSRTGVISKIEAVFEPSESFKPFYRDIRINVTAAGEQFGKGLPQPIKEGDACIIKLSTNIEIVNWKQEFGHEEIQNMSNLREAIRNSIELDKLDYSNFVGFFKRHDPFGTLRINMTHSTRKGFRTREIAQTKVENRSKPDTIEGIERLLKYWDTESAVNSILRNLPSLLNDLIKNLSENMRRIESGTRNLDDISSLLNNIKDRRYGGLVFEREKGIMTQLDEVSKQIRRCNQISEIVSQAGETPEQVAVLDEEVKLTKEGICRLLLKLTGLRDKLIGEIQPR